MSLDKFLETVCENNGVAWESKDKKDLCCANYDCPYIKKEDVIYDKFVNRECWEEPEPVHDFKYIGKTDIPKIEGGCEAYTLHQYNCIRKGCRNYMTTITQHNLLEHYKEYHRELEGNVGQQ